MKFFFDNCISPVYVEAMATLAALQHHDLHHLREFFSPEAKDVEWIRELGRDGGWTIISGDPRIARSKAEKAAWHESGLTAFFFAEEWASRNYWKQIEALVHWWPAIVLETGRCKVGSGFLVHIKSKELKQIYTP